MADSTILPSGGPTREEIAKIELGQRLARPPRGGGPGPLLSLPPPSLSPAVAAVVPGRPGRPGAGVRLGLAGGPAPGPPGGAGGGVARHPRPLAAPPRPHPPRRGPARAIRERARGRVSARPDSPSAGTARGERMAGRRQERVYVGRRDADGVQWLFYRP